MCGRYVLSKPGSVVDEVLETLDGFELESAVQAGTLAPRFNVAPTQPMPILRSAANASAGSGRTRTTEKILLEQARWGFTGSGKAPLFNARSETIGEKKSFQHSFEQRRCLIPATGFFEWRPKGNRQPFYFHRGGAGFCFAGLWRPSTQRPSTHQRPSTQGAPSATEIEFCIVTGVAGAAMGEIHHRRPIILEPASYATWLSIGAAGAGVERLDPLLRSDPALERYPVDFRVNKVANDDATLLEPVAEAPTNLSLF